MRIVVIGGSGFLGSHVADKLTSAGHDVTIFDKGKSEWISNNQKNDSRRCSYMSDLEKLFQKVMLYIILQLLQILMRLKPNLK